MRPVDQIIDLISTLSLPEAKRVDDVLHRYIAQVEEWQHSAPAVVEQIAIDGGCYRLELVKCGKPTCKKCGAGPSHGPYWYHYAYDAGRGRQRKTYIGKQRPSDTIARNEGNDRAGDQQEDDERGQLVPVLP